MNKSTISLIITQLLIICFCSYSQEYVKYPTIDGRVVFEKIIEYDSISSDVLYQHSKSYFVLNTGNANMSIQLDDKENGIMIGQAIIPNLGRMVDGYSLGAPWYFKIRFDTKKGKVRVRLYDFVKKTSYGDDGVSIELQNKSYEVEIANKSKRANTLSAEAQYLTGAALLYIAKLEKHIYLELNDDF